tara:strand:+ start:846 stop:1184 length:339 start_codon:yes stop_codon:yes gene_type:complete
MNKYINTNAANTTKTYNKNKIEDQTNNIYEAISIIAKRSNQINSEIKKELHDKLDEFATHNDSLEEIFENKEQIEVSRFYEKLPKPYAIAVQEWLDNKIYFRDTESESDSDQ